ncbi:IS66 family insertion sequence element accessory protein TnpB [Rhizobium laguerreae]|uniref:IS66 family insertion sequence element accessory protein TnpB n=1 Tax=Rhizobium laguerreae TaxID=1076926 RepID=UPI001C8FB9A4|nr:IS66 family insertion sequence element accessory protein TnpB [Rhizobium laguerreae]MBY3503301.1 IS66 family insertion sequence element accessory protein TnpB [Rhizobium laguerreae]MBY3575811.1 IS66 family insertion sequence element accessory protein TnpB [Rhizobium laguerreae]
MCVATKTTGSRKGRHTENFFAPAGYSHSRFCLFTVLYIYVRVYLACGVTDMRRGIDGLSALVETVVKEAPGSGAIFGFRGKRADRIKLLWWDGQGFCLFYNDQRSYYTSFLAS